MRLAVRHRILQDERGFTLIEVLVTMMIMITVMFALYSIFDMSLRVFSFGNDKVEAVENARLGMEKMEREIRAAYPVNKIPDPPLEHLFFAPGSPSVPVVPGMNTITFGNDLPQGADPPNRRILNPDTNVAEPGEEITYAVSGSTLTRNGQPVVENVAPGGLTFTYLRSNLQSATAADGADIGVVRISLKIDVDGRIQTLTTDVDLKNEGR
jgi:prepilin-type N-terminal cleavage/methylation domain-containing protein